MKMHLVHQVAQGAKKNDIRTIRRKAMALLPSHIAAMKTDPVVVRAKVNLPEIQLVTFRIGPFSSDSEVTLERWQAEILAKWGIVEWPKDSGFLLSQAYASRDTEQGGRSVDAIIDIFHLFPEIARALKAEGLATQKMGAVKALYEDIVSSRTNKITRAARMGQDLGEALSPEELWLYNSLRKIFDVWRQETERLVEPEGTDST